MCFLGAKLCVCVCVRVRCHEINSHEINSHEINSHEINSHEINSHTINPFFFGDLLPVNCVELWHSVAMFIELLRCCQKVRVV